MIHLNTKASEGPRLTLFQQNFLLAHEVIDPSYFIQHALSWLSPRIVALSLCSENPSFITQALTPLSSLPEEVSVENLL